MNNRIAIGLLVLPFAFTGCSSVTKNVEKRVEDAMMQKLLSDEDYNAYLQMKENGELDSENQYISTIPSILDDEGKVHVTFAENTYLRVSYFLDAALTQPIDVNSCYLEANDCIYAAAPEVRDGSNSAYHFSEFRVWIYGENGKRVGKLNIENSEENLILQIPMDEQITELSVEPIGCYEGRRLSLYDYYTDADGKQQKLTGTWSINDESYTGDIASISSVIPYSVKYQYHPEEYFLVAAEPENYSHNESKGEVNFHKTPGLYDETQYSVELHPYIKAVGDKGEKNIRSIKVNGKDAALPCKLKFGDVVVVETSSEYRLSCNQLKPEQPEKLADGYRFSITITDEITASELLLRTQKWSSKDISFDVPKENIWDMISGLFSDKTEDNLLTVRSGDEELTYKKLKNGKTVTLDETDQLQIIVGDEIRNTPHIAFVISVNGANPVRITKASEQKILTLQYDEVESVKITVEKGYVFSSSNINNGDLRVQYLVDGKREVKEGEFLAEGTQVVVKVIDVPAGIEITGGAVKPGSKTGSVIISDSTKSADFVVNSRKNDHT